MRHRPLRLRLPNRLFPIVVGAFLGFVVGCALVMIRRRESTLTTRDEIAEVAGVPVLLSVTVGHLSRPSEWLALLREHKPSVTELWNVRKVLRSLDSPEVGPRVLTVISLADDSSSVAVVAHFAVTAATMEIPTSLVLTSEDSASRGLSDAVAISSPPATRWRAQIRLFKGSAPVDDADRALTVNSIVVNPDQPKLPGCGTRHGRSGCLCEFS